MGAERPAPPGRGGRPRTSHRRIRRGLHFGLWAAVVLVAFSWTVSVPTSAGLPAATHVAVRGGASPSGGALANANWSILPEAVAPPPRGEATFTWATFGGQQVGVLFGGRPNFTALSNETWIFSGGTWHQLHTTVEPSARRGAMAAFDPIDGYVVLFGGSSGTAYENDTWVFNGTNWSELAIVHSPPARRVGGFAYDVADGYLLLFSGHNGTSLGINANFTTIDDTWTFLHGQWTELFPSVQPLGRSESSEVYDPAVGAIVVFGGYTTQPEYLAYDDTWTFRAGVWTPLSLSPAPSPRDGAPMAFDPAINAVVVEGGQNESGNLSTLELDDTWLLEGTNVAGLAWHPVGVASELLPADSGNMVYDPELGTVLVFGGHSGEHGDIWYNTTAALVFPLSVGVSANRTGGAPSLSYNFTSTTTGGLAPWTYVWKFNDSGMSTRPDPVHEYASRGNYTVRLDVTDALGTQAHAEINISAYRHFAATLNESDGTTSIGSAVLLVATSRGGIGVLEYTWPKLPPGCTSQNVSQLSCSPNALGSFHIAVTVTDSTHASSSAEQNLTVVRGNSTPVGTTKTTPSKFPAWVFAAGVVVVLALLLALVLWARNRTMANGRPTPRTRTPPPSP